MTSPNDFLPADYKAPRKIGDNSYMRYMKLRSTLKVFSNLVGEFLPPSKYKVVIKNHLLSISFILGDAEQEEKEDVKQLSIPLDASLNPDYGQVNLNGIYPYDLLPKDSKPPL